MNPAFLRKVKRNDRIARWIITIGGMAIIFSVIFILILIAKVSMPLFWSPDIQVQSSFKLSGEASPDRILALGMDEYRETGYTIDDNGLVRFFKIGDGVSLDDYQLKSESGAQRLASVQTYGHLEHVLLW